MVSFRAHLAAVAALVLLATASDGSGSTNLNDWLAAQSRIRTWAADFIQTRTLKALAEPLKAEGRIWFADGQFRWELGQQTIAVRRTNEMLIIYPKLKRVERYPTSAGGNASWRDMLALLEAGFPRSQTEVEERFRVLSVTADGGRGQVRLQPKSSQARRWISEIQIVFDQQTLGLVATELKFADGSTLRNDFSNVRVNESIDQNLFSPVLSPDWKVVEPLGKRR